LNNPQNWQQLLTPRMHVVAVERCLCGSIKNSHYGPG